MPQIKRKLASLIPKIHRIEKTFEYGMYFILVFSVVVASMADLRYFSASHIQIFYWVILVYFGSLILHIGLAKIFKIDADNVIIVSTALTCSPAFVPVVASALKNKGVKKSQMVFTTHTPEKAGNEERDARHLNRCGFFGKTLTDKQLEKEMVNGGMINYTVSALRMCKNANAVSKLHAKARRTLRI